MIYFRFIRTLRLHVAKILQSRAETSPHKALLKAVSIYNETPHSETGIAPTEAFSANNRAKIIERQMRKQLTQSMHAIKVKFSIGQLVRLRNIKISAFSKSGDETYSHDLYRITAIKRDSPQPSYHLQSSLTGVSLPGTIPQNHLIAYGNVAK